MRQRRKTNLMIYGIALLMIGIFIGVPTLKAKAEAAVDANGKAVQEKTVKILLVGNSLTRCPANAEGRTIKEHLKKMASASGKSVVIKTVAYGGAALRNYVGMVPGKKHRAKIFKKRLKSEEWDYIILQELSKYHYVDAEEKSLPAIEKMLKQIKKEAPGAQVMLYVPRGYDLVENEDYDNLEAMEMECHMGAAGDRISDRFDIPVIQVGMQFYRCSIHYPDIRMLGADKKHPTRAGYFLAASCIYQAIFGEKPEINKAMLEHAAVSKAKAEQLIGLWGEGMKSQTVEVTLQEGTSQMMHVMDESDVAMMEIRYTSLDDAVATVDDVTGEITAVGGGMTVIVAETQEGWQAYCTVYVPYDLPTGLKTKADAAMLANGEGVSEVCLSWDKRENTSYAVYRAKSEKGPYKRIGTTKTGEYVDRTATLGKTWYYKIAAENGYAACASKRTEAVSVSLR